MNRVSSRGSDDTHRRLDAFHRVGGLRVLRVVRWLRFWRQLACELQQNSSGNTKAERMLGKQEYCYVRAGFGSVSVL